MATNPKTVFRNADEYIVLQPDHTRAHLELIRQTIKTAAPEAMEVISYAMPAFKFHGMLAWYAAAKNHCGLYIRPRIMQEFTERLSEYELTKSAIHFPYSKPLPDQLVSDIIKHAASENLSEKIQKDDLKKKKPKP